MSRRLFLAALLILCSSSASLADSESQIRSRSRDLDKIKEELNRKREEQERLKREAQEISESLKDSQERQKNLEQTLLHTRKKTGEVSQQVAVAKLRHDKVASTYQHSSEQFQGALQRYYVASLIQGPSAPGPAYGRQLIRTRASEVRGLRNEADLARRSLRELAQTEQVLRGELANQSSSLTRIRSGIQDKEKLLTKKLTRREVLENELKELERTRNEMASFIESLRTKAKAERDAEKKERIARQTAGDSPILARSLPWPARGKITTRFGRQTHPTLGTPFISSGIVIETPNTREIASVADGKVLYAGEFMSYGSMVVVEHPGDWFTVYGRLSRWFVQKGEDVKKGQNLGTSRPSESGGGEMYFELRFYGKPTDPAPWMAP